MIFSEIRFERVEGAKDQIRFISENTPIKQISLKHEDINVSYNFMTWNISNGGKNFLIYDNHTNVPAYNVIVELENGKIQEFIIENLNKDESV